jgi:hypothetical protein
MNVKTTGIVLSTWLAAVGWTGAQSAKNSDKEPAERPTSRVRMYEDIEILRRILLGKLQKVYALPSAQSKHVLTHTSTSDGVKRRWLSRGSYDNPKQGMFGGNGGVGETSVATSNQYLVPSSPRSPGLEGFYLKGKGVFYTMTLPRLAGDPRALGTETPSKPLSEWERTRKEMRHEKVGTADKELGRKGPGLTETILKVLAENGHHFARLDDKETLTVVVTFRAPSLAGWLSGEVVLQQGLQGDPELVARLKTLDEKVKAKKALGEEDVVLAVRDYELLGDLHARQGKSQEALACYAQAVRLLNGNSSQFKDAKQVAGLYGKVAQVYLALQQNEAARKAILTSLEYLKRIDDSETKPAKSAKGRSSVALPAKLIISASKKVLDQAGAGKMTFADFVKEAQVEYLPFTNKKENPKER